MLESHLSVEAARMQVKLSTYLLTQVVPERLVSSGLIRVVQQEWVQADKWWTQGGKQLADTVQLDLMAFK